MTPREMAEKTLDDSFRSMYGPKSYPEVLGVLANAVAKAIEEAVAEKDRLIAAQAERIAQQSEIMARYAEKQS